MAAAKSFASVAKKVFTLSIDPASINSGVVSVQTFTAPGATQDMFLVHQVDSWEFADVRIVNARVSAANTIELSFFNFGGSTRDLAAFTIKLLGL